MLFSKGKEHDIVSYVESGPKTRSARKTFTEEEAATLESGTLSLMKGYTSGFPEITPQSVELLGDQLFKLAFYGEPLELIRSLLSDRNSKFAIEFSVEDPSLAHLPWELMCQDESRSFICRESCKLSRAYTRRGDAKRSKLKSEGLQVLLCIGVGPNEPGVDAAEQVKALTNVFEIAGKDGLVTVKPIRIGNLEQFHDSLSTGEHYDVLHFYGHAGYDRRRKEGYLQFSNLRGGKERAYASEVASAVTGRNIQLVFLNGCKTGVEDGGHSDPNALPYSNSVAGALFANGLPHVIATQFPMPDNTAHIFARSVYRRLAEGLSVEDAVHETRLKLKYLLGDAPWDWAIPVLFSHHPQASIFRAPRERVGGQHT